MEHVIRDMKLNGVGKAAGGRYNRVLIDGVGTINGEVQCEELHCSGQMKLNAPLTAGRIHINGTGKITGPVQSGDLHTDGMLKVEQEVRFDKLVMNGIFKGGAGASGEHAEIYGSLSLKGDLQCETLELQGNIQIEGLLNAGTVKIEMIGNCRAREIGGEHITIRKHSRTRRVLEMFSGRLASRFTADVIEGDDIELENTKARVVRGSRVRIGPGCEIEYVEYKETYEADPKSDVSKAKHI
ncbi:cell shape determination protein CcmA [Paenibacillus sp. YPG26]|uniref:cell shape determination protein CcmA n=1 Tax=Paenibacillus sp. YPG26 TaxID=2878915 RepID=UPI00203B50FC|nr:cell shape determination protein CcmA [Paenibacillus sp. YPG26]USB32812.1 cell shape determination protein CcmA [Paenibacillus sp. YPG26]